MYYTDLSLLRVVVAGSLVGVVAAPVQAWRGSRAPCHAHALHHHLNDTTMGGQSHIETDEGNHDLFKDYVSSNRNVMAGQKIFYDFSISQDVTMVAYHFLNIILLIMQFSRSNAMAILIQSVSY